MLGLRGPLLRTGAALAVGPGAERAVAVLKLRKGFGCRRTAVIWSISSLARSSQKMASALPGCIADLIPAIFCNLLQSFWMASISRDSLMLSMKVALLASRTLSRMGSLIPAKYSWCLKNKAMSLCLRPWLGQRWRRQAWWRPWWRACCQWGSHRRSEPCGNSHS